MKTKFGVIGKQGKLITKKLPFENASEALSGWLSGCRVVGLTKGQFSLIDMINVMLEKIGPSDIVVSTWSAGLRDSSSLHEMYLSGQVKSVLIILDRSYATRQPQYAVTVEQAFGKENIRTTNTHAKFVLLKSETAKICIRSSMNLNKNDRCENFDLDDDPDIFDFYMEFVNEIFEAIKQEGLTVKNKDVGSEFKRLMKTPVTDEEIEANTWGSDLSKWD